MHHVKKFKLSDGEEREYTILKGRDNVIVFCITETKQIIVIEQFRTGPELVLLNLPGGGIEENETPEKAGSREVEEETGYFTNSIKIIASSYISPTREGKYYFALATNCKKTQKPRKSEKQLGKIKLLNVEEFKAYLFSGKLTASDVSAGTLGLLYALDNHLLIS